MSDDNEFQRSDAATGNVCRPTGMVAQAVSVTMLTEVDDDWTSSTSKYK